MDSKVMVPVEITEEMHVAAVRTLHRCTGNDDFPRRVWRAMIAAAPKAEQPQAQDERDIHQVYDLIGLHHSQPIYALMENLSNMKRFAEMLHAVEREFFMVPGEPDEDYPDAEPDDECLVNSWGSTQEQYIEQFRAALAQKPEALAAQEGGMPVSQEPKYGIRDNRLYNRASGEFIPADEPVFIFRAKDNQAVHALQEYVAMCFNDVHRAVVVSRVCAFLDFAKRNPDRMKFPDTSALTTAQPADKEGKAEQHSDDMNDAVLRGIVLASQGEAGDMLSEMDVLKDEQQAEPALCAWLERAARSGIAEVEHAARTMMAFYQGAEFPEPPAQQLSEEEICKAVAEITKPPKSRKYQTLCDDVPADQVYDFAIDLVRALLAKGK